MTEPVAQGMVRGFLHRPDADDVVAGIVLAHGAGSDCNSKPIVAMANAFAEAGVAALRIDLPFRQARKSGPPYPSTASRDRDGLREACVYLGSFGQVWLGGHSYGGRQASMLASEEPALCAKLLLLSYPLHSPAKPQQMRTAHFAALAVPSFFLHGTRDPFGTPAEMESALRLIAAPHKLQLIDRAGHDLKPLLTSATSAAKAFIQWPGTTSEP
ncbi:MAG: alpha/beta fold hydrolase [Bryobacteraceae bacterium]|nr:alpha/beta fold hydrolase [Bryobacteraceae bacterium]